MVNYKDRFTPEQLKELYNFSFVECSEDALTWDYIIPATAPELSEDVRHILTALFDEHREKYPDEYLTPIEATLKAGNDAPADLDQIAEELEDLYLTFWHDVVFEIFKDRIEVKDDGTLWTKEGGVTNPAQHSVVLFDKNTYLTIVTDAKHSRKIRSLSEPLPGQLQYSIDKQGNIKLIKTPGKIKEAIKALGNIEGVNVELLDLIGTAIETTLKNGHRGWLSIPRTGIEDAIGTQIYKPLNGEINYILHGTIPENVEDKEKYISNIEKHYGFWIDLLGLYKAGTVQTTDGPAMLFNFRRYNETDDAIECESPYLQYVYEDIYNNPITGPLRNNNPEYVIPEVSHNTKPSIISERNKTAIEAYYHINRRIKERGIIPDARCKKHLKAKDNKIITLFITYKDVIAGCPSLMRKLGPKVNEDGTTTPPTAKYKRQELERAIIQKTKSKTTKAKYPKIEAVIRDHSDLFKRYVNLKIECDPISLKALNTTGIHIEHYGISAEYDQAPALHAPNIF